MKKLILLIIIATALLSCGKNEYKVSGEVNVNHRITTDLFEQITKFCEENYADDVEQYDCIDKLLDMIDVKNY